jgi:hypothetical protein
VFAILGEPARRMRLALFFTPQNIRSAPTLQARIPRSVRTTPESPRSTDGHFETVTSSNGILLSGHSCSPVVSSGGSRYS